MIERLTNENNQLNFELNEIQRLFNLERNILHNKMTV
jgi:hypothetical protein